MKPCKHPLCPDSGPCKKGRKKNVIAVSGTMRIIPKWKLSGRACSHATCPPQGPCRRPVKAVGRRCSIPKLSKKRGKENRQYLALRKTFLQAYPKCQARLAGCRIDVTEIHHMAGRVGEKLLDHEDFLAVCDHCHRWIEGHPKEARALGLSLSRLSNEQSEPANY